MTKLSDDTRELAEWLEMNIDPANPLYGLGEAETLHEFVEYYPEWKWCVDNLTLITPHHIDHYREQDKSVLESAVLSFCKTRYLWSKAKVQEAIEDDFKSLVKPFTAYMNYAHKACNQTAVSHVVKLFCSECTISASELNSSPAVLGTPLGVLDLDEGVLVSEITDDALEQKDYVSTAKLWHVTKTTNGVPESLTHEPDLDIDPRWQEFIDEIMLGDEQRADYLQRALGYSCFGANPEEVMFIAYGATTRNGKGTLLESVAYALGEYATSTDRDYLMEAAYGASHVEETAALDGIRLVTISEPTRGKHLDEGKVKALTGGDMISTRHLYGKQFTYRPQFTMWLACNRLPLVRDTTIFTSGRIKVIPFEKHFDEVEQDSTLKTRFRTRRGAHTVLMWLLEGYQEWVEMGLAEPESIKAATRAYVGVGGNSLTRFIDEYCVLGGSFSCHVSDFTDAYKAYCEAADESPMSDRKYTREFEGLGVSRKKGTKGVRMLVGITLKDSCQKLIEECESTDSNKDSSRVIKLD